MREGYHGAGKKQQTSRVMYNRTRLRRRAWNMRRGSCRFKIWVERLEYLEASWRACNTYGAQPRKITCMNRLENGSSFLVTSITWKALPSALIGRPRLVRISLFHHENEAKLIEKWINTDSLLWTQQFQCRSTTLGRVKGKPKRVTDPRACWWKQCPHWRIKKHTSKPLFSPQSFLCLLYISSKGLRVGRTAIFTQDIASCSPMTKTSKELYLTFF